MKGVVSLTIEELEGETGFAPRQVRYLIAEGLVPAPTGGRAHARYGEEHLAAIAKYKRLRAIGFSPAQIRLLVQASDGVPIEIEAGITLVLDPKFIGSGRDSGPIAERLVAKLRSALKDEADDVR